MLLDRRFGTGIAIGRTTFFMKNIKVHEPNSKRIYTEQGILA